MEIVLFRIRTRAGIDAQEYDRAFEHMLELVKDVAGFIDIEGFAGDDGSELALARFESPEAIAGWRDHPEHVLIQQRGRDEFFETYEITIATVSRNYSWPTVEQGSLEAPT